MLDDEITNEHMHAQYDVYRRKEVVSECVRACVNQGKTIVHTLEPQAAIK